MFSSRRGKPTGRCCRSGRPDTAIRLSVLFGVRRKHAARQRRAAGRRRSAIEQRSADAPQFRPGRVDFGGVHEWKNELLSTGLRAISSGATAGSAAKFETFAANTPLARRLRALPRDKATPRQRPWYEWRHDSRAPRAGGAGIARAVRRPHRRREVLSVLVLPPMERGQRTTPQRQRRQDHRRHADICRARLRRRLVSSGQFKLERGRHAESRRRRAAGLLSARRDSSGATRSTIGTRCSSDGFRWWIETYSGDAADWSTSSASIIFAGLPPRGRFPATTRPPRTANGSTCPGQELFATLKRELGELPFIAEDLGVITPEVEALRDDFGLPGHARSCSCLRRRREKSRSAAQLHPQLRRLHRHARQRHDRRLVDVAGRCGLDSRRIVRSATNASSA